MDSSDSSHVVGGLVDKFPNLTDEELLTLTPSAIDLLTRRRLMEKGVLIMAEPVYEEEIEVELKSRVDVYVIPCLDFGFMRQEDAEKVHNLLIEIQRGKDSCMKVEYDYNKGSEYKYLSPMSSYDLDKISITKKTVYTKEEVDGVKEELKNFQNLKERNIKKRADYRDYKEGYFEEFNAVQEVITRAKGRVEDRERVVSQFTEYLTLSNGDFEKALGFFKLAVPELGKTQEDFLRSCFIKE